MMHRAGSPLTQALTTLALAAVGALATFPSSLWAAMAFQESSGQVVMEAERADAKTPRNGKDWVLQTSQSGSSGSGYLTALPNSGVSTNTGYTTASPELVYNVSFTTTGTYYLWVRAVGPSGNDDTVHAGIDGTGPSSADRLNGFGTGWTWRRSTMDSSPATLIVSTPGLHTIHLWMREDGFRVDKLLLRRSSSSTAPSGTGPAESPRVSVGGDTTKPTGSVTINGGAAATNTPAVTLTLSATDDSRTVSQMQFSNDGATYTTPEAYATTKAWTLTSGDGAKTVYAKFKDAAGNWSAAATDTITLDSTAPVISAVTSSNISTTAAQIAWTTNESATCWANHYCPAGNVCVQVIWFSTGPGTNHSVTLSGLTPGTRYQFPIYCNDAASNKAEQPVDFSTQADTTPPLITFTSPTDGQILVAP